MVRLSIDVSRYPVHLFSDSAIEDLSRVLGNQFSFALPSLMLLIGPWKHRFEAARADLEARRQLPKLLAAIGRLEGVIEATEPVIKTLLAKAGAPMRARGRTAAMELAALKTALARTRETVQRVKRTRTPFPPGDDLAGCVASALREVPLSKGRDGQFARVLSIVWHDLAGDDAPSELFPYLRRAVTAAVARGEALQVRRGRPPKSVKTRSANNPR